MDRYAATVDDLFDSVSWWLDGQLPGGVEAIVTVEYDPEMGYPFRLEVVVPDADDAGLSVAVSDFRPL